MAHFINHLVHAWGLSPMHYWHLRLLTALLLTPLLGVLYVVLFDRPGAQRQAGSCGIAKQQRLIVGSLQRR